MARVTTPSTVSQRDALTTVIGWIALFMPIGILIQAFLASYGLFEGEPSLISVHGVFGMVLVVLVALNGGLVTVLVARGQAAWSQLATVLVVLLVYVVQLGLGFATRTDAGMAAWHVPLGVLLMGGAVANAVRSRAMWNGERV